MNEILQKRFEEAANTTVKNLYDYAKQTRNPKVSAYSEGYLDAIDVQGDFLFREGANYALSNQWVSVDEALPKCDKCHLAMYEDGGIIVAKYENETWWWQDGFVVGRNTEGDLMYSSSCEVPSGLITHWAPIPSLEGGEK